MWMKTAIKRLCSFLPRTEQLSLAVELDDKAERGETQWLNDDDAGLDLSAPDDLNTILAGDDNIIDAEAEATSGSPAAPPVDEAKPQSKPKNIDAVSEECWEICNKKGLILDDVLSMHLPNVKKGDMTLAQWNDFLISLK